MADLLVGVLVLPFSVVLAVSSCWCLEELFYRYYAVCQPLRYRTKINVRVIVIMILVSWTVSALIAFSITILGVNQGQSTRRCALFQNIHLAFVVIVFGFYIPAIIMFTIYLKILMVAQRQACSIQNTTCQSTKSEIKKERKSTKTLAIVMGVFLICWTLFFLCMTFNPLSNYTIPVAVIAALKWLGWSNSMLNPLVYAFFYNWFLLTHYL
ncbi:trace amine-associated receptor 1-like [Morone saxatilis]|uniref:trace amine-associated receptor 1-like n=1 Tax=Morone saxatilis TaxID=34816 RepID=UPI0015E1ECDF|nr:trace amine-associated receptor 1-like [Morone saxatilis]